MRGKFEDQGGLFSYISPETRVPKDHPLRRIRELVRDAGEEQAVVPSIASYTRALAHGDIQFPSVSED